MILFEKYIISMQNSLLLESYIYLNCMQQIYNQICEVQHSKKNWAIETLSMLVGARLDDGSQICSTKL